MPSWSSAIHLQSKEALPRLLRWRACRRLGPTSPPTSLASPRHAQPTSPPTSLADAFGRHVHPPTSLASLRHGYARAHRFCRRPRLLRWRKVHGGPIKWQNMLEYCCILDLQLGLELLFSLQLQRLLHVDLIRRKQLHMNVALSLLEKHDLLLM